MKPQWPVTRSDAEWRKLLKPEQYVVMRTFGTEPAGSCALNQRDAAGHFRLRRLRSAVVRRADQI